MKIINSKIHGTLDYLVGIILIILPWLFGFADGGAQMQIPIILGIGTLIYSMITKYELGVFKIIPFKTHLSIDALSGIFLAASPWIFGFSDQVYQPHLLFGILEIVVVLLSKRQTSSGTSDVRHTAAF